MEKGIKHLIVLALSLCLASCMTVRQADTDAWIGQPVASLEKHPIFITMPVVRTIASDGTEIRNYVNGRNIGQCSGGGSIFSNTIDFATYSRFSSCMSSFAACNNIFYIKNGRVIRSTPVGSGGAQCYTDDRFKPDFNMSTNYR